LPGTANPDGSPKYRQAYVLLADEARRRQCEYRMVEYPGWGTTANGLLNFPAALEAALRECGTFKPDWIIGRSLGCDVAVAVLSSEESWVSQCSGACLWGPSTSADIQRVWPSLKSQLDEMESYAKDYATFVAEDYFTSIPPFEKAIAGAAGNLRLARGAEDWDNTAEGLMALAETHRKSQPSFCVEIVQGIPGLEHTVTGKEPREAVTAYLSCLFDPVRGSGRR
jgi:hypothetical protein